MRLGSHGLPTPGIADSGVRNYGLSDLSSVFLHSKDKESSAQLSLLYKNQVTEKV